MKKKNTHGGSRTANRNGLLFEQNTSLPEALTQTRYTLVQNKRVKSRVKAYDIFYNGEKVGYTTRGARMYKDVFLPQNIDCRQYVSQEMWPDDAFVDVRHKTVFILEKKFQSRGGSVDEKLQTCDFKKWQYEKMFSTIGYQVKYVYILSDWFKKDRYKDVLEYIIARGCYYFYNEIPLSFLNL